jgi:hypothetical protein
VILAIYPLFFFIDGVSQMPPNAIPRYQPTFRKDEIELIIRLASRGESVGLVGVAGVGKSNIVNFLRDLPHHSPPSAEEGAQLYFPIVDAPQWTGAPDSLWQMMVDALDQATRQLVARSGDDKVIPFDKDARSFKSLQERLKRICLELGYKVMFILDDFDQVIAQGPLPMLERLNGLRSDQLRGFLSYLVITKRLPHILGRPYDFENQSKFYDLFRPHIYALEPYNRADALQMLQHLNELARSPLTDQQLEQIYQLAGGHARLLRLAFNIWVEEGVSGLKAAYFANKADIQQECRRILVNLHEHEQEVALRIAKGNPITNDKDVINHLANRGLLVKTDPPAWFSSLFDQFLRTYQG